MMSIQDEVLILQECSILRLQNQLFMFSHVEERFPARRSEETGVSVRMPLIVG